MPDELKKIPDAFQKGFEESTENSKARNAKQMEDVPDKKDATKEWNNLERQALCWFESPRNS